MSGLRQIVRGCGTLPYVGEHPGTGFVVMLILLGGSAGAQGGGWLGFFVGAAIMAVVMGPLYLWGAYDRACISDRLTAKAASSGNVKAEDRERM